MKITVLSTFALLSLFAMNPVRANVATTQEMICTEGHYDATTKAAHSCAMINQRIAEDDPDNGAARGG